MKIKNSKTKSLQVLSDDDLNKHGQHLLGIGTLRRAVVGEGPGTSADLERISQNRKALSALTYIFSLESDGAVYTHGRDFYLWLLPTMSIPAFDMHRCSVKKFFRGLSTFQKWINAKEQMIATGVRRALSSEWSNEQKKAACRLASIESKLGDGLVMAYARWLTEWASNTTMEYTIFNRGNKPIDLRIPPRIRVIQQIEAGLNITPVHQVRENEIKKVKPVLIVRTACGMTMHTDLSNNAAHLKVGQEFYYRAPTQESENTMRIHKLGEE